jgi:hypothetical protein
MLVHLFTPYLNAMQSLARDPFRITKRLVAASRELILKAVTL